MTRADLLAHWRRLAECDNPHAVAALRIMTRDVKRIAEARKLLDEMADYVEAPRGNIMTRLDAYLAESDE